MPNKKILVLTGVLVVAALASWFFDRAKKAGGEHDVRIGEAVLSPALLAEVSAVHIKKVDGEVQLQKDAQSRWQLTADGFFPASAEKVVQFLESLAKAKVVRLSETKPADAAAYELSDQQFVKITTAAAQPPLEVQMGKMRGGGGQFIRFAGEEKVYLTDQSVFLEATPAAWELRTLANVGKEKIKEITFQPHDTKAKEARLTRDKAEDPFKLAGAADDAKLNSAELTQAQNILANVGFTHRYKKDMSDYATVFANADTAVVTTFDGVVYNVQVGSKTPPAAKDAKDKPKATWFVALRLQPAGEAGKAEAELINPLMEQWVFEVDEPVAARFRKGQKDFLENNKG